MTPFEPAALLIAEPLGLQRMWIDGRDCWTEILLALACDERQAWCGSAEMVLAALRGGHPLRSTAALYRAKPIPIPSPSRYLR